jgi:hypothetical protein
MARRKPRGSVRTSYELPEWFDPILVAPGYVMARHFTARWTAPTGARVEVAVEVVDPKHAVAKRVAIEKEGGVSSTSLREIDLRNIIATACLDALWAVEFDKDGRWHAAPDRAQPDEVRRIVLHLVGYVRDREVDKRRGTVEVGP